MRVCFFEPTASVLGLSTYAAHNILEPLGIEMLAAFVEQHGFDASVVQQRCNSREDALDAITRTGPQVLAITTLTYNIDDALWFAREAKTQIPGLAVVLGGYHATAVPEIVLQPEVDYVVVGEGEIPLLALLTALQRGEGKTGIPGVAVKRGGAVCFSGRAQTVKSLDALPVAHRSRGTLNECRMHGLMYPPPSLQRAVGTVSASRGCPHACAFCSSALIWQGTVRTRSPRAVADELVQLHGTCGVNAVFFSDLTFNASKRYTMALCEEIASRNLPVHFYAMCTLAGMDSEVAQAMKRAKCEKIGFGVESFNPETRGGMKDGGGMKLEDANAVMDLVTDAGILVKAYFIIGFPWETHESLKEMCGQLTALRADEIKVTFYVPFPGTHGYAMHRHLLLTEDWGRFTTLSEPIVRNESVSVDEMIGYRQKMFRDFYGGTLWTERRKRRSARCAQHRLAFDEFACFLRRHGILGEGAK